MAVSDHWYQVAKMRGTIMAVDPANNIIDIRCGDGSPRRIMVWEVPSGFRWPVDGEEWSIYEQNGSWYLGDRSNNPQDGLPISAMTPGDQRLDGKKVFDAAGNRILSVNMTGLDDGEGLIYDALNDRMKVAPPAPPTIFPYTNQTATYSVLTTDMFVFCSGTFTVTLPSAVTTTSKPFFIINTGTGTITVAATAGTVNYTSLSPGTSIQYMSNGTNWYAV